MASSKSSRIRISLVSIIASTVILGLKFAAFIYTGSTALKSDALESVVNVVAAVFALGAVYYAEQPADANHPYGHGKIEHFSAAFEGGLISLAAVLILYEGAHALLHPASLTHLSSGLLLNLGAGSLNGLLGFWLIRAGKATNSHAIEADGRHVLTDFYTTIALGAGLLIVYLTGLVWLDAILALLVGIMLCVTGFKLVKQSSNALLDREDDATVIKVVRAMNHNKTPYVIGVHALRTLRTGRYHHIDIHVAVPEFMPVSQVHDDVDRFGRAVLKDLQIEGEFHVHIDPCRKLYCKNCAVAPCAIRREPFTDLQAIEIARAVSMEP